MGTAQYLSPEQAQGMEVTAAADIYSIGMILFEMLCGRVPFDGDNAVAIAMKQVGEDPPVPSSINPEVAPALDAVVLRALAKDPAQRFRPPTPMTASTRAATAAEARARGLRRLRRCLADGDRSPPTRTLGAHAGGWIRRPIALVLLAARAALVAYS